MANNAFGIDLGTNNIKIYNRNDDNIMIEKNMIAIENKNTLFAYGNSAFEMYEKAPSNIHISYPLSNGVIADIKNMETLVKYFIGDLQKGNTKPSDFFIAVPTDVTEVEKRAFYDLIKGANVKAKKIMVVEKAVADGLGLDIDVKNSLGVLVVNVGYETTEISILSLGGIVLSRLIKVGGMKFDDAIRAAVRREFSMASSSVSLLIFFSFSRISSASINSLFIFFISSSFYQSLSESYLKFNCQSDQGNVLLFKCA